MSTDKRAAERRALETSLRRFLADRHPQPGPCVILPEPPKTSRDSKVLTSVR